MEGSDLEALARRVLEACEARGMALLTAESLTGGLISATLSSVPGSSRVLAGGLVTYASELKTSLLGVDAGLIAARGVVSEEVARAMARGALRHAPRERAVAVAVTGVAGPGPSGDGTAAGTVHVGCAVLGGAETHRALAFGDAGREEVRRATVRAALELVLEALLR
ncbi:MAG: nicotinamide-nucleotide amidohydrolase family protein [Polyangiaceae bacterium]|nr:nicotinamide-nucleotide amidohydrolase family protein [Polyangiaceae bacterium]